jgi:hypothetical protein
MATFAVFMLGLGLGLIVAGLLMLAAQARPTPHVRPPRSPEYHAAIARVRAHTRGPRFHG